jgi:hypothetical protein
MLALTQVHGMPHTRPRVLEQSLAWGDRDRHDSFDPSRSSAITAWNAREHFADTNNMIKGSIDYGRT